MVANFRANKFQTLYFGAPCHQRSSTIEFDWTGNFCGRHPWSCNTRLGSKTGFICSANKTGLFKTSVFCCWTCWLGTNCLLTSDSQQTRNFLKRSWKHFCLQQSIMNFFNSLFLILILILYNVHWTILLLSWPLVFWSLCKWHSKMTDHK